MTDEENDEMENAETQVREKSAMKIKRNTKAEVCLTFNSKLTGGQKYFLNSNICTKISSDCLLVPTEDK